MMVVTPAIQNLIRENKTYRIDSSIQTGRKHGMFLLDESLFKLWKNGLVRKGRSADASLRSRPSWPAKIAAAEARHLRGRGRRSRTRTRTTRRKRTTMTRNEDDDDAALAGGDRRERARHSNLP